MHTDAHSHAFACMHTHLVKLVVAFLREMKFQMKYIPGIPVPAVRSQTHPLTVV